MRRTRMAVTALAVVLGVPAAIDLAGPGAASPPATTANGGAGRIEAGLQATLATASPDDFVAAVVVVRGQADLSDLTASRRRLRPAAAERLLRAAAEGHQRSLLGWLATARSAGSVASATPLWIDNTVSVRATAAALRQIAARTDVVRVDPDRTFVAPATLPAIPAEGNITRVGAPALWDLGFTGQGVVVANLDTGVDATHPDLASRWRGGTNSWYDPNGEHPTTPTDVNGHGTATMGVMVGGTAGGTAIGMAPGARWIAAKIFNDHGAASSTAIHLAMQWLLDPDGNPATADAPDVVNNSWTMTSAGCVLDFAPDLANLRAAGILPVFAAGNYGPTPGTVLSPANNPAAFAVGAVDAADVVDPSSSRGPSACDLDATPALAAPGVGIHTTDLFGLYTDASGTSLAAPHVAGALALLLSAFPETSADRQATALRAGAVDLGAAGPDNDYGYGRLDVAASYAWLASTATPDFTVAVTPPALTVNAGAAGTATVTIGAVAGFTGTVTLSLTGLPATVGSATFTPPTVTGSGGSTLRIAVAAGAPAGSYPLTIGGTEGAVAHSAPLTLVVPARDFTITVKPASVSVARGKAAKYTITITSLGGFTGSVKLAVSGLPAGATKTFVPNPVAGGAGTATLTIKTVATTPRGTFHPKVTATSGTLSHSITLTLIVS